MIIDCGNHFIMWTYIRSSCCTLWICYNFVNYTSVKLHPPKYSFSVSLCPGFSPTTQELLAKPMWRVALRRSLGKKARWSAFTFSSRNVNLLRAEHAFAFSGQGIQGEETHLEASVGHNSSWTAMYWSSPQSPDRKQFTEAQELVGLIRKQEARWTGPAG